jgi:hypothetical protein
VTDSRKVIVKLELADGSIVYITADVGPSLGDQLLDTRIKGIKIDVEKPPERSTWVTVLDATR